ncbi:mitochondrial chaperone BCS1 [Amylocarpus encephaloides]|uniref:Mitochondrial chaperone BCS1 n=1 Tax=Amylocarpus encephaloides TaxID=45428 RepID=A0A9P7YBI6_9HELO|nr:mitochondrial chaperone BCS1 [Amylocarpus encephaloides]
MSTPLPPTTGLGSFLPLDTLFDNPVFAGGFGLGALGAAAALGRRGVVSAAGLIKRRLLVDVEISKKDESYRWILAWLSRPRPTPGFIASKLTRRHHFEMHTPPSKNNSATPYRLQPGYGRQIIRHDGAYISVERRKQNTSNHTTGEPHETLTLTTLYAQRHVFDVMFNEAYSLARAVEKDKTTMYAVEMMGWRPIGEPRNKRPLASVILDKGIKEPIVNDAKEFLASQKWYVDRGIPYRRGYLLYGPPGSGKSSFIQALAGELDFGIATINLSARGITDDLLAKLLTEAPRRSIILLEDADAAFVNRQVKGGDGYSGQTVTFSGLLNALDGVTAGEERISFLTTNHIERLDPALIRPGRVDMTVRIGEASKHQAAEMWTRFYSELDVDGSKRSRFLHRLEELGLVPCEGQPAKFRTSTAAIQGLFLFNKDNPNRAIEMVEGLIPKIYEPEVQEGIKVRA